MPGFDISTSTSMVEPTGTIGFNEDAVTVSGLWSVANWSVYGQLRYLGSAVFSNADNEFTRDIRDVDSWSVFNAAVSYQLNDRAMMQLNVDNLFDEGPPFAALASPRGLTTYFPGVIGRTARLSLRVSF